MLNKEEIFEKISPVLKKKGVKKIAVFGSYARDEEKPGSDIDIIVEFSERKSLLDLVRYRKRVIRNSGNTRGFAD